MRSTNSGQEVSHHQVFWYFPGANISIFICTSGLSQEAMVLKKIISFTSSSGNPLHSNSCNYFFHMNHYMLPTLQPHSPKISVLTARAHATTDLSQIKLQASCRTLLNVYFVNHTCSNFILPENTAQPWGTGWVWCSLLWGGPLLWMAAVWKCIVEAQISLWTFLLGCRAPFELSHNCSDLVHTCSLLELWVGGTSGASPVQTWLSFILKTIEVNKGLSTGFFKLEGRPTFLHFKGHQNSIEYFQASVESPPYCCKARRVTCSASFFHKPSRHTFTVFIFFSLTQRKFRQIGRDKSQARNLEKILFSFPLPKLTFTQTLH